ncbi:MAG: ABC-2 family transporter protein [Nitrospinae bacterium]|nr:ABC-2 family transporter protein [Nitrospinota bacterium]
MRAGSGETAAFGGAALPVYLNFAIKTFQSQLAYKFEYFVGVFNGLLYIFIFTALWGAIYSAMPAGAQNSFTQPQIITYAVFALVCRVSMSMDDTDIAGRVRTGDIAMDMIKPVNFTLMVLANAMGETMFHWFTRVAPIILVCLLSFDIIVPTAPERYLLGAVAWILGYSISFLLNFSFALLAFWFVETFSFQLMKYGLLNIFSGSVVPIDFFPEWAKPAIAAMPFQYILYTPTAVFMGHITGAGAYKLIALQGVWVVILGGVSYVMWNAAKRKLVVQGG